MQWLDESKKRANEEYKNEEIKKGKDVRLLYDSTCSSWPQQ